MIYCGLYCDAQAARSLSLNMNSTVAKLAQGAVVPTLQGAYAGMLRSVKEQPARPSGVWDQRNAAMAHGAAMKIFCQGRIPVVCISLQHQHVEEKRRPMNMQICWCPVNNPVQSAASSQFCSGIVLAQVTLTAAALKPQSKTVTSLHKRLRYPLISARGNSVDQKAYGAKVAKQEIQESEWIQSMHNPSTAKVFRVRQESGEGYSE